MADKKRLTGYEGPVDSFGDRQARNRAEMQRQIADLIAQNKDEDEESLQRLFKEVEKSVDSFVLDTYALETDYIPRFQEANPLRGH